jgi:hypothetical protein
MEWACSQSALCMQALRVCWSLQDHFIGVQIGSAGVDLG